MPGRTWCSGSGSAWISHSFRSVHRLACAVLRPRPRHVSGRMQHCLHDRSLSETGLVHRAIRTCQRSKEVRSRERRGPCLFKEDRGTLGTRSPEVLTRATSSIPFVRRHHHHTKFEGMAATTDAAFVNCTGTLSGADGRRPFFYGAFAAYPRSDVRFAPTTVTAGSTQVTPSSSFAPYALLVLGKYGHVFVLI